MKKTKFPLIIYLSCLLTSIALIVGGFFVPPMGVIDGSVIQSVGELLAFATLGMSPSIISSAKSVKSTKFTTRTGASIEVESREPTKEPAYAND